MTQREMEIYDELVAVGLATIEELNLARNLMDGSWTDVLNAVIFVRTGYRTFEQLMSEEMEEE